MRAILAGGGSPLSGRVLTPPKLRQGRRAHKALRPRLAATADCRGLVTVSYRLVDPLFGEWIGRLRDEPRE